MKIILILSVTVLLITPCSAEQWICFPEQATAYSYDNNLINCKSYSSFRLKKPIITRSNKKYKDIVETFYESRAVSNCSYNSIH